MAGLLDFIKTPRSDNPNRKASLADRSQIYNLLDNIIGFNDDRVTPGEALGAGLRNDPIGLLSGAVRGVQGDLNNLMFEGQAMQRPFDVMGYAAAPMAPGAMSGRMANVLSSGGAKPTLDQMRANARQRIADRAKMVQDLTQDASPVRMKSGDLSVLVSKSPDREGWRVTYFQPDGSPSGHVDAKDKSGAVQRALEDQFTPIAARPAPTPSRPLNPAEQMAKDVLDMRAAGRAGEVTDEMMSQADPQYMFANTPLPMDEASRMARGKDAQISIPGFHGGPDDIVAVDPARLGGVDALGRALYTAINPARTEEFALDGVTIPLMTTRRDLLADYIPPNAGFSDALRSAGVSDDTISSLPNAMWQFTELKRALGSERATNIAKRLGFEGVDDADTFATFDPTRLRSRFARFDPEFKHLRNLSAGVGGMGLLGMSYPQEEQY